MIIIPRKNTSQSTLPEPSKKYTIGLPGGLLGAMRGSEDKLAVKESKPVLMVIEPVVVPGEKSAPRRSIIIAGFLFLGIVVACGWVLAKPYMVTLARSVKSGEPGNDPAL